MEQSNIIDSNLKTINNHLHSTTRASKFILGWIFCVIIIIILERYQISNEFYILQGDNTDSIISAAILEHWFNVIKLSNNWLDVRYFYPYTRTIAQTDAFFLIGLIYTPIRIMGSDPFLSLEICFIILKIIGFWGTYLFARKIKFDFWSASLLACLFTLANILNINPHLQLMSVVFLPVMLCCLFEFWKGITTINKTKILIWGGVSGLLYGALCLTCFYIAWFFIFIFIIFCIIFWIITDKKYKKLIVSQIFECRYQLLIIVCISAISLIPFIYAFYPKSQEVGVRSYAEANYYIPQIWSFFDLTEQNLMYGTLFKKLIPFLPISYKSVYNYTGYGFFLSGLFLLGGYEFLLEKIGKHNMFFKALVITVFVVIIFTIKVEEHSAWYFIYHLFPGSKALRVVAIAYMCLYFPVILVAIKFLRKLNVGTPLFILISVILLLGEISVPALGLNRKIEIKKISDIKTPPNSCKVFYVSGWDWQKSSSDVMDQLYPHNVTAMMIAQIVKIPTINGFASFNPQDWVFGFPYKDDYDQRVIYYAKQHNIEGLCRLNLNNKSWSNPIPTMFPGGTLSLEKNTDLFSKFFLKDGWSLPEPNHVWMNTPEAHLSLNVGKDFTGTLSLDIGAFLPHTDSVQNVSIYINNKHVSKIRFSAEKNQQRVVIPLKNLTQDTVNVKFVDHDIVSPQAVGISDDPRTLGVLLLGLSVQAMGTFTPVAGVATAQIASMSSVLGDFSVQKNTNLFSKFFLKNGWSQLESEFVWMNAPEAHLSLNVGKDFTGTLLLDIDAFLPHPDSVQNVSIYINDKPVSQVKFNAEKNRQRVAIPLKNLMQDIIDVKFVDPDIVSPKAAGISDDSRTLGVQLWGLSVQNKK
jgi:hypothetical protein